MSFSLIHDKWIPTDRGISISLLDAFEGQHSLGGNPNEKIAIFNLLLAIATAACNLQNEEEWRALTNEILSERCKTYLSQRESVFMLDTFLQVKQLDAVYQQTQQDTMVKPFGQLIPIKMQKSNAVFRGNTVNRDLNDDEKILAILEGMTNCKGGKGFNRYLGGKSSTTAKKGLYLTYLHSLYFLSDIVTTIRYSIVTQEYIEQHHQLGDTMGAPCWDMMPTSDGDPVCQTLMTSFLGRLLPLSRFISIKPDDTQYVYYSDGLVYPEENYQLFSATSAGKGKFLPAKTTEAPWKQLKASLSLDDPLSWQCHLVYQRMIDEENFSKVTLWLGGTQIKNSVGEYFFTDKDGFVESMLLLDGHTLFGENAEWKERYIGLLKIYESNATLLSNSIQSYYTKVNMKKEASGIKSNAVNRYWSLMSPTVPKLIKYANGQLSDTERENLVQFMQKTVVRLYEQNCPRTDGPTMVAFGQNFPMKKEGVKNGKRSSKKKG